MTRTQISKVREFTGFFVKKLRLGNPWNYKAPLLICAPYLVFLLSGYQHTAIFYSMLCSMVVIIGVAGIGYLSNDLGDREKDALAGKENALIGMPLSHVIGLFVLFLSLAILPWFYLPFNRFSAWLLGLELLLFLMYALPPFRLKELGLLGVYTDALYAHVLPAMLASYTFYLFTGNTVVDFEFYLIGLCGWQFILGVRNIMFHQLKDLESDARSGTRTFVVFIGQIRALRLVNWILLLEGAALLCFLAMLALFWGKYLIGMAAAVYWLLTFLSHKKELAKADFRQRAYLLLDDFYIKWLPLAVLAQLCFNSAIYIPLLAAHLLLFKNDVRAYILQKFN